MSIKKKLLGVICAGVLFLSVQAQAQTGDISITQAKAATPISVAMIFYALTRQVPDFDVWARWTEEYRTAAPINRAAVREKKAVELQQYFSLLTLADPIAVEVPVLLSQYSPTNKGFTIENFTDDAFFGFSFAGKNYAIIPQALMDHQWMEAEPEIANVIDREAHLASRILPMLVYIDPKFADGKTPIVLKGKSYWLISGEIRNMTLYTNTKSSILWQRSGKKYSDQVHNELLNLRQ